MKPKPQPIALVPSWSQDKNGKITAVRGAAFWHPTRNRKGKPIIQCDLCYRQCQLNRNETGWCDYRGNRDGRMQLKAHGVISCAVRVVAGYGVDPFLTFKPGQTTLFLGATSCTAGCVFCMSKEITWQPSAVPWLGGKPHTLAHSGGQYHARSYLHPEGAVALAQEWGCQRILFGINEPSMSYEYTLDVAQLARRAGLDVCLETNGFCGRKVVERLAPYVSAIDLGIKGSADPAFYDKWMRSEGAVPHVLESGKAWSDAGNVHVIVGDLIAPPQMQTDATFEESARRLYAWIAEELGPDTCVLITAIEKPGPQRPGKRESGEGLLVPKRDGISAIIAYEQRQERTLDLAHAAGLHYAHRKRVVETFTCRQCAAPLLQIRSFCEDAWTCRTDGSTYEPCTPGDGGTPYFCPFWGHDQHVISVPDQPGGTCAHCGATVPITVLSAEAWAEARRVVRQNAGHLIREGVVVV
jgi:pyruvate-formate lyase-activating enzyme